MFKLTVTIALAGLIAVAVAMPQVDKTILEAAKQARVRAFQAFQGHVPRQAVPTIGEGSHEEVDLDALAPKPARSLSGKIYSIYTQGKHALGGGKPTRNDWNQKHKYVPLAPTVVPHEKSKWPTEYVTPEEMAQRIRPQQPYQFTTD